MATPIDISAGIAIEFALCGLAGFVLQRLYGRASFVPHRVKLLPFNRGVVLHGDTVEKVVQPGFRWVLPGRTLVPVDIRPKPFQVPVHEVIAADNGGVRIGFGGEYKVSDPALYLRESSDAFGTLFLALERVIPSAGSEFDTQTLLTTPSLLAERIQELIEPRAAQLGITITSLEVANVVSMGWVLKPAEPI